MRLYHDTTTHRLDELARRLGLLVEVLVGEPSEEGRYFLTRLDGQVLESPRPLGWTDEQAELSLRRAAADPAWLHGERDV